jgi:hypothetical protein
MGSPDPNPDWDLSGTRTQFHFDGNLTCSDREGEFGLTCDEDILVQPETICFDSTPGDGDACTCPTSGIQGEVNFTVRTPLDGFVYGETYDKVKGKEVLVSVGAFEFNATVFNAEVKYENGICWIQHFPSLTSKTDNEIVGTVKRTLTGGVDEIDSDMIQPGCEDVEDGNPCITELGSADFPNLKKLLAAFPAVPELGVVDGQSLLVVQDQSGGSSIYFNPCPGEWDGSNNPDSISCSSGGKRPEGTMSTELAVECTGNWTPAQLNGSGSNPHWFEILSRQQGCDASQIDPLTIEINGKTPDFCEVDVDLDGIAPNDARCSITETVVGEFAEPQTCASSDDDGERIAVRAEGQIMVENDVVPFEAVEMNIPCKFN